VRPVARDRAVPAAILADDPPASSIRGEIRGSDAAGTRIELTLWWDDSAENPNNPDPTVDDRWDLPTYAEMGYRFMQYRELAERQIVAGETMAVDVQNSAAGGDPTDGHTHVDDQGSHPSHDAGGQP
jgi:hypothetical protein